MGAVTVAVIGIDHRHIYGQLEGMLSVGCQCAGWWTQGEPDTAAGFIKRFPDIPRVDDYHTLLSDDTIDLILIADIPARRASLAIEAMQSGKDVMTDKPGCTTLAQLTALRETVATTGRIWSIDFSERFEVPAVLKAAQLVAAGEIGEVVQTVGLGPHRLNLPTRPEWFFDEQQYGGILCDIASHQIDQFLFFTGSTSAEIVTSSVGNFAHPEHPGLQDFGDIVLRSTSGHENSFSSHENGFSGHENSFSGHVKTDTAQLGHAQMGSGYIRVDWYTPDALPNWGDGRLTILGTEGYIELRKYVDVAGRDGTDHVYIVNGSRCDYIDASDEPLTYFAALKADVLERTETAMPQSHCFTVMQLALEAQAQATRTGHLVTQPAHP